MEMAAIFNLMLIIRLLVDTCAADALSSSQSKFFLCTSDGSCFFCIISSGMIKIDDNFI